MKKRIPIIIAMALGLCFIASPAWGIVVQLTGPNTTVILTTTIVLEDPPIGSTIAGGTVLEWRDADYQPATPPPYKDWVKFGTGLIDGGSGEVWIRGNGQLGIATTTTVPGSVVSIHLNGDNNDGIAEVLVDGTTYAILDMNTASPPSPLPFERALIIVKNLSIGPHFIEVIDLGATAQPGRFGTDVAVFGAAVLDYPIPTFTEWGIIIFGTLLLCSVIYYVWRRRQLVTLQT